MNTNEVQLLKHTNRLEIAKRANNRLFIVVSKVDVFFSTTGKRARSVCVCAAPVVRAIRWSMRFEF